MIVVLDTNVIFSGLASPNGTPARVLNFWRQQEFATVHSPALLEELRRVLLSGKAVRYISNEEAVAFLQAFAELSAEVLPEKTIDILGDDADNRILEAALSGRADYIVTGDKMLLEPGEYEGSAIVTPARFLAILSTRA